MTGYYLFFRCWPGFTDPFPFDRFNSLPDDELAKALDAYAREQLHAEKPTIKRIRRERKRKLGKRPSRIELPWRPPNTAQRQHYDYRVRGTYRRSPLICRVGAYLGWWNSADARSAGVAAGRVHGWVVGPQVWMLEADDQAFAEHLVAELNDKQILDLHRCKTAYLLTSNPCFGYVPSEGFSTAERASIQRQINAIRDGQQPGVRGGEASLLIGKRACAVALQVEEAWGEVTNVGGISQRTPEETVPAEDDFSEEGTSEQPGGEARSDESAIPKEYHDWEDPKKPVLTAEYVSRPETYDLSGPYLSRHYGEGKELTSRVKVGRTYAYLFAEIAALSTKKTERTDKSD